MYNIHEVFSEVVLKLLWEKYKKPETKFLVPGRSTKKRLPWKPVLFLPKKRQLQLQKLPAKREGSYQEAVFQGEHCQVALHQEKLRVSLGEQFERDGWEWSLFSVDRQFKVVHRRIWRLNMRLHPKQCFLRNVSRDNLCQKKVLVTRQI